MTDLPAIKGVAEATVADAQAVVADLDPYKAYLASDLYRRYLALCAIRQTDPASTNAFGRRLRKIGCAKCKSGFGKAARTAWRVVPGAQDPRWADGTWI